MAWGTAVSGQDGGRRSALYGVVSEERVVAERRVVPQDRVVPERVRPWCVETVVGTAGSAAMEDRGRGGKEGEIAVFRGAVTREPGFFMAGA